MKKQELTYRPLGEGTLLIEWPSRIDEKILQDILSLNRKIEDRLREKIDETQNTYHALTIFFTPEIISYSELINFIKEIQAEENEQLNDFSAAVWEIPVCYDIQFGIDLDVISKAKNLSIEEIVKLHSETSYTVYFGGFLPGFLYLGGLSEKLFTPRKETPRASIRKGAVAIGGSQTGIYPQESPGGWHIIGNSPIVLFDVNENPPTRIKAGDKIKFIPISKKEYDVLSERIRTDAFELKSHQI